MQQKQFKLNFDSAAVTVQPDVAQSPRANSFAISVGSPTVVLAPVILVDRKRPLVCSRSRDYPLSASVAADWLFSCCIFKCQKRLSDLQKETAKAGTGRRNYPL